MLNLKKTAVAVLALSSSAVFAGTMGPVCTPGNVTVPCERSAWNFGGDALYLEVMNNDPLQYIGYANGTTTNYQDLRNRYGWGFKLEGSYHFNTGNDINLNWYHLNANKSRDLTNADFIPDPNSAPTTVVDITTGSVKFKPRWDQVNLEVGQFVDFGEYKDIRFHAGAQYTNLQRKFSSNFTGSNGTVYTWYGNNKFNGFGPRVGADLTYGFGNGLAIYGDAAVSLLVGTTKFNSTRTPALTVLPNPYGSKRSVVPEMDAKLGIKYDYAMPQGDLTLDVGWMVVNYFNAYQRYSSKGDISLQGLYFGAKWTGAIAM